MIHHCNPIVAREARARFVSLFVTLLNSRVDYAFEAMLFTFIFIGSPTLFVFLILPLHAFGTISDLSLFMFTYFLMLIAVVTYACTVFRHMRISSECIELVFEKNPTMRKVLYQSADAQWADADEAYS